MTKGYTLVNVGSFTDQTWKYNTKWYN